MRSAVAALTLLPGLAAAQVPLPADVVLARPGAEVPAELARFAGAWGQGAFGPLTAALVVESVQPDGRVTAIYATGAAAQFDAQPRWDRLSGVIAGGRLALQIRGGGTLEFLPDGAALLAVRVFPQGWRATALLQRVPGDAGVVAAALARPVPPPWQERRIPVMTPAGPVPLQVFRYWPARAGRVPVVVFNHGSTDGERPGVPSIQPFEAQARLFLARGWGVVVPMRKGRGLSGGVMMEPSTLAVPSEAQLESGIEDVDAVVEALRAEPGVDAARIVVAGQSRGGLLALAYAGRHAGKVAGVIDIAGGWWSDRSGLAGFNVEQVRAAGLRARVPTLWLYAARDTMYGLESVRGWFAAFREAGGEGTLVEVVDLPGMVTRWLDGRTGGGRMRPRSWRGSKRGAELRRGGVLGRTRVCIGAAPCYSRASASDPGA